MKKSVFIGTLLVILSFVAQSAFADNTTTGSGVNIVNGNNVLNNKIAILVQRLKKQVNNNDLVFQSKLLKIINQLKVIQDSERYLKQREQILYIVNVLSTYLNTPSSESSNNISQEIDTYISWLDKNYEKKAFQDYIGATKFSESIKGLPNEEAVKLYNKEKQQMLEKTEHKFMELSQYEEQFVLNIYALSGKNFKIFQSAINETGKKMKNNTSIEYVYKAGHNFSTELKYNEQNIDKNIKARVQWIQDYQKAYAKGPVKIPQPILTYYYKIKIPDSLLK